MLPEDIKKGKQNPSSNTNLDSYNTYSNTERKAERVLTTADTALNLYREYRGNDFPDLGEYMPQPSLKERDRRWQLIREQMLLWNLDCLLVWGSDSQFTLCEAGFRYVTSIPNSNGRSLCIFPRKGDPIAFVGESHCHYVSYIYKWVGTVRPFASAGDVLGILKEMGFASGRIGFVGDIPHYWPFVLQYNIWSDILKGMPQADFVNFAPALWNITMIKSEEELAFLRTAGKIAPKVYEALLSALRPGALECEVYAEMQRAMTANGGESTSMILMDIGNPVFPHAKFPPVNMRPIKQGDMAITEYHVKYAGFQTHTERTVSLGKPSSETMDLYSIGLECYRSAMKVLKPGCLFKDAMIALRKPVRDNGMAFAECGFHSHGSTSGGFPTFGVASIDEHIDDYSNLEPVMIRENMVFTHMIDLYNPKIKNAHGMMLADSFVVTKDGPEVFASIPLELAVV